MSARLVRDAAVILACTLAGQWIAPYLPIPIPGSIVGMLLLFGLLSAGVVRADWVEQGSALLVRNMAVMFVPLGVGLVAYLDVLRDGVVPFALSTVVSTLVTMAVVALVFDRGRP